MPDEKINGRYRLLKPLGSGGQGDVHLAFDEKLNRKVAIKVMKAAVDEDGADSESIRIFRREAKLTAMFSHPNVVNVFDYDISEDGMPFIVMEYLKGLTLNKVRPALTSDELVMFVRQVCSAMQHAHDREMVHRDLKPQNVMLIDRGMPEQRFIILDLGIAKLADVTAQKSPTLGDITFAGAGTPLYMSPEQMTGLSVDHRSDIYSFGSILFLLLTGSAPFEAHRKSLHELLEAVAGTAAPRLVQSDSSRKFSQQLEKLIAECLAKEPAKRPDSMQELADRFLAAMAKSPIASREPIPSPQREATPPPSRSDRAKDEPSTGQLVQQTIAEKQNDPLEDDSPASEQTVIESSGARKTGDTDVPVRNKSGTAGEMTQAIAVDPPGKPGRIHLDVDRTFHPGMVTPDAEEFDTDQSIPLFEAADQPSGKVVATDVAEEPADEFAAEESTSTDIIDTATAMSALEELGALVETNAGGDVIGVNFSETMSHDAELRYLKPLVHLRRLVLTGTLITDMGLAGLSGLSELVDIRLDHTEITDEGLVHLNGMAGLRELNLRDTGVSRAGVDTLQASLPNAVIFTNAPQAPVVESPVIEPPVVEQPIVEPPVSEPEPEESKPAEQAEVKPESWQAADTAVADVLISFGGKIDFAAKQDGRDTLTSVDLSNTEISDADLDHLTQLDRLRRLDLSGTNVTDSGLKRLESLVGLRELSLGGTKVTDQGLAGLIQLVNLEKLSLNSAQISGKGLRFLSRLSNLQELNVFDTDVTAEDVEELERALPKLRVLVKITPDAVIPVDGFTEDEEKKEDAADSTPDTTPEAEEAAVEELNRLGARITLNEFDKCRTVSLSGSTIDNDDLQSLAVLSELHRVSIHSPLVTNQGLVHLEGLRNLEVLSLSRCDISDAGLVHVSGLSGLVSLNIPGIAITDKGLEHLRNLKNLELLNLAYCMRLTDKGLKALTELPNLTRLSIESSLITQRGFNCLRDMKSLQVLEIFSSPEIDDDGLEELKALGRLHDIEIKLSLRHRSFITDEGLEHLSFLDNLIEIDLRNSKVSRSAIRKLRSDLPNCNFRT